MELAVREHLDVMKCARCEVRWPIRQHVLTAQFPPDFRKCPAEIAVVIRSEVGAASCISQRFQDPFALFCIIVILNRRAFWRDHRNWGNYSEENVRTRKKEC